MNLKKEKPMQIRNTVSMTRTVAYRPTALAAILLASATVSAQLRVDFNAPGPTHDGSSWAFAHLTFQDALASHPSPPQEFWVAAGTYYPSATHGGTTARHTTFHIPAGFKVYGGFLGNAAGGNETLLQQRNPELNLTILDGNFQNDADPTNNSYHVVYFDGGNFDTTKLSGFTIRNGYANGSGNDARGAGVFIHPGAGSAFAVSLNRLVVKDCFAADGGAGMYISNANGVAQGHVVYFANGWLQGNATHASGGGILVEDGLCELQNVVFWDNSAVLNGGGIAGIKPQGKAGQANVSNCTFHQNQAGQIGGAVYGAGPGTAPVAIVENSILWANTNDEAGSANNVRIDNSVVSGGWPGGNNVIDADPLFREPALGNFRLKYSLANSVPPCLSPCLDQ